MSESAMIFLCVILPIFLLGLSKWRQQDEGIANGTIKGCRPSKGFADFMLYDFDRHPGDFK